MTVSTTTRTWKRRQKTHYFFLETDIKNGKKGGRERKRRKTNE